MDTPAPKVSNVDPKASVAAAAHFVGVGGAGMRALASVMREMGWRISGSDVSTADFKPLSACGIQVFTGHAAGNVPLDASVLVRSAAVSEANDELSFARRMQIPVRTYGEMLGEISRPLETLAIAGTHGKSTVTAMVAEILFHAGLDPTVVCGAVPKTKPSVRSLVNPAHTLAIGRCGGRRGKGKFAVVEACEYRGNFLHLQPKVAAILNLEHDHFDCYETPAQMMAAFEQWIHRVSSDGLIITSEDCHEIREIARATGRHVVTFGVASESNWRATNLAHSRGRYRFDLVRHGRRLTRVVLSVAGRHNVTNAVAAAAVARHCGVSAQQIASGLASFRGLRQRMELRGRFGAAHWIDDYAHHPTAVQETLLAVRQMFPQQPVVCVFQPHQAARLTVLLDEFALALHNADAIAVADVYRAREAGPQPGERTAFDLAERLRSGGCDVIDEHDPQAIAALLAERLQPGDVLVTLGAGDLGKHFDEFHKRIGRNCAVA